MTRYTLTYGTLVKVLQYSPEGWDESNISIVRNEVYGGLFRTVSANVRFVEDGAAILRHAFYTYGTNANVYLKIERYNKLAMAWETVLAAGEIDFTEAKDSRDYFEAPIIDGGLSAKIKSQENVKWQLETPADTILRYSGIRLYAASPIWNKSYFITENVNYLDSNHSLPIVNTPVADPTDGSFTAVTVNDSTAVVFPDTHFFTAERDLIADVSVSASNLSMTTYLASGDYNGGTEQDRWYVSVYLYHLDSTGAVKATYTVNTRSIIPTNLSGGFYTNTIGGSIAYTGTVNMLAGERLKLNWRWYPTDNDQLYTGHAKFSETATSVQVDVLAVLPEIEIRSYTAKDLFTELISKISAGTPVKSTFLDNLPADYTPLFVSGDAIRAISPYLFKLSFLDFFKTMAAIFDCSFGVETISGIETAVLEARSYFFDSTTAFSLGEASDVSITTASNLLYKTIGVGYPNQEYKELNGRDEFNAGQQWSLPFQRINNEETRLSPVRADMYGIDNVRIVYYGNDNTDTDSDNDVFIVDSDFVETIGASNFYIVSRAKVVALSNVENPDTAYNVYYSPKRCLLRHASELAGVCWGMSGNIEFVSADKNSFMTSLITGATIAENGDIAISSLGAKLFYPVMFEITVAQGSTMWTLLTTTGNKQLSFTYNGNTYYGFIMECGLNIDHRTSLKFSLLCSPDTDLTLLT